MNHYNNMINILKKQKKQQKKKMIIKEIQKCIKIGQKNQVQKLKE